jgi:hypothetical protein
MPDPEKEFLPFEEKERRFHMVLLLVPTCFRRRKSGISVESRAGRNNSPYAGKQFADVE